MVQRKRLNIGKKFYSVAAASILTICILFSQQADAKIYYVDASSDGGDGSSWEESLNEESFSQTLNEIAESGDIFYLAKGVYRPVVPTEEALSTDLIKVTFNLKSGVSIYGGFSGIEESLDERDFRQNRTVLTGDIYEDDDRDDDGVTKSYAGIKGANSKVVVTTKKTEGPTILDGVTVTGGDGSNGGGMANSGGSIIVRNCTYRGNRSRGFGGGMMNAMNSPTIEDCHFLYNRSGLRGSGGAISNVRSQALISNCLFENNLNGTSSDIPGDCLGTGGAVYNGRGEALVSECVFRENESGAAGGAVYNQNCNDKVTIERCLFENNKTFHNSGAIRNTSSATNIVDCTFIENKTVIEGGAIYNTDSDCHIENSTFEGNEAKAEGFEDDDKGSGGAIYNSKSHPVIENCTFVANKAKNGGAIYNRVNSSPYIVNCTFNGNESTKEGAALYVTSCFDLAIAEGKESQALILNSILWSNKGNSEVTVTNGAKIGIFSSIIDGLSLNGEGIISSDIWNEDPLLKTISDNGGYSKTCALEEGSYAIDKGLNFEKLSSSDFPSPELYWTGRWQAKEIKTVSTDQREVLRPQKKGIDLGSYEYPSIEPTAPAGTDQIAGGLTPTIVIRASISDGDHLRKASLEIASDREFKNIIYRCNKGCAYAKELAASTKGASSETITIEIPENVLSYNDSYYWRSKTLSDQSGWSEWSETSRLITPSTNSSGGCQIAPFTLGTLLLLTPMMFLK